MTADDLPPATYYIGPVEGPFDYVQAGLEEWAATPVALPPWIVASLSGAVGFVGVVLAVLVGELGAPWWAIAAVVWVTVAMATGTWVAAAAVRLPDHARMAEWERV